VAITRADQVGAEELDELRARLQQLAPVARLVASRHKVVGLSALDGSALGDYDADQPLCLVSAIARPAAFERSAADFGLKVGCHARYRDHHVFRIEDLVQVCAFAKDAGAAAVLLTEKDAVKVAAIQFDWPLPVRVLRIAIDFLDDGAMIVDQMLKRVMAAVH
jgi:tetraacyldisaccharide-1-P 4'-kinase